MGWEISFLQVLANLRGEVLDIIFQIITLMGEGTLLIGIIAVIYWCINKKTGLKLGFIMLFSMMGNGFIKNIVKAQRPFDLGIVEGIRKHTATGYSFPSGHTQSATTFWVTWMIHIKEKWIYCLGSIMIILIALSRLYLGVHWPVDVLAAILVGIVFTLMGQSVFQKMEKLRIPILLLICAGIGSALLLNFDNDFTKTVGAMIGLIIGFGLEDRYICFTTEGSVKVQILKVSIGLVGLIVVAGGLKLMLPQLMIFDFLRYMTIVIWIISGAPYIFNKIIK